MESIAVAADVDAGVGSWVCEWRQHLAGHRARGSMGAASRERQQQEMPASELSSDGAGNDVVCDCGGEEHRLGMARLFMGTAAVQSARGSLDRARARRQMEALAC